MVIFYKKLKKYYETQLTKNKMDLNIRKMTNHPPSPVIVAQLQCVTNCEKLSQQTLPNSCDSTECHRRHMTGLTATISAAFNWGVGTTSHMYNRVTNRSDKGIFFNCQPGLEVSHHNYSHRQIVKSSHLKWAGVFQSASNWWCASSLASMLWSLGEIKLE